MARPEPDGPPWRDPSQAEGGRVLTARAEDPVNLTPDAAAPMRMAGGAGLPSRRRRGGGRDVVDQAGRAPSGGGPRRRTGGHRAGRGGGRTDRVGLGVVLGAFDAADR